ncbi:MAG: PAC2 family protein, partial [Candidatus Bathyarchaeia archaeon]
MIVIRDGEDLRGCVFITGFHGIGQAGHIATSYLVHELKARRIGFLRAMEIPPFVTTSEEGLITPFELYKAGKFIMLRLEFPPSRRDEPAIIRDIASWIVEEGLEEAVLIGGLDAKFRQPDDMEELKVAPTSAY